MARNRASPVFPDPTLSFSGFLKPGSLAAPPFLGYTVPVAVDLVTQRPGILAASEMSEGLLTPHGS